MQRVSSLQSSLSGSKNQLNLARMSQTIPYSIFLTSVYSGDLGLQIIQRTSPEYPWIDSSAQRTVEACIPQFFFRGLSHVWPFFAMPCNALPFLACRAEEGAGMVRILLTHSIRNPLSSLLTFSPLFRFLFPQYLQKYK